MMTLRDIASLPEDEQPLTRASHDYYRALLRGLPETSLRQLRRTWLAEVQHVWPDALRLH